MFHTLDNNRVNIMKLQQINAYTNLLITNHQYEFLYSFDVVVAGYSPVLGYFRITGYKHDLVTKEINNYVKDAEYIRLEPRQIESLMMGVSLHAL